MSQGDPPSPTLAGPWPLQLGKSECEGCVPVISVATALVSLILFWGSPLFTAGSWDFKSPSQSTLHKCLQCRSTFYELTDSLSWDSHLTFWGRQQGASVSTWPTEESVSRNHCCASLGCAGEPWPLGLLTLGRQEVLWELKQSWKSLRTKC